MKGNNTPDNELTIDQLDEVVGGSAPMGLGGSMPSTTSVAHHHVGAFAMLTQGHASFEVAAPAAAPISQAPMALGGSSEHGVISDPAHDEELVLAITTHGAEPMGLGGNR